MGVSLMEAGQDEGRAEEELRTALRLSHPPEASLARLYLANLYIRRGDLIPAIQQAEIYLREVPEAEDAEDIRAHIAQLRAKLEEGMRAK